MSMLTKTIPARRDQSSRHMSRTIKSLLAVAGLVVIGVVVWESGVKYRFLPKRFGVVESGQIFRSGQISKWMIEETLLANNIQVVIDMNGDDPTDEHQQAEVATVEALGLEHHRFPLAGDGTGDITRYADAIEVIARSAEQQQPVLVHCSAGAQRTGGVVAAYRVLVQQKPGDEAYAELLQYKWDPQTDQILVDFVNSHMQELAEMLVARGVIEHVPDPLPVVQP